MPGLQLKFVIADRSRGELTAEFSPPSTENVIILGVCVIARHMGWLEIFQSIPMISEERMSCFALFVIGLLTSVHCIAMCGGFNLAQSITSGNIKPLRRSILYNLGRLSGYTFIGDILGFIGEKAAITIHAGLRHRRR